MRLVRALTCVLAALALAGPGLAADKKQQNERPGRETGPKQTEDAERKRVEDQRQLLRTMGYEALKPFRDCPDCPEMLVIPAGSFAMGSPADEVGRYSAEGPQHQVNIGTMFALGKTEVTQGQWRALMGSNPSHFSACGELCPVEQVSWHDAQDYVRELSKRTGKRYRLPSEAEWEYAARAGTTTPFSTGNCIQSDDANYDGNYDYNYCRVTRKNARQRTLPVGSFAANGFALHDMHGNVWEWVEDCWHEDYQGAPRDGSAWTSGSCDKRVLRGGSWKAEPRALRSAERNWEWAKDPGNAHGFRVARTLF